MSSQVPAAPVSRPAEAFQVAARATGLSTRGHRASCAWRTAQPCEGRGLRHLPRQRVSAGRAALQAAARASRRGRQATQQQAPPRASVPGGRNRPQRGCPRLASPSSRGRGRGCQRRGRRMARGGLQLNSRATPTPGAHLERLTEEQIRSPAPGPELRRPPGTAGQRRGARRPRSSRGAANGAAKSARGPAQAAALWRLQPRGRGGPDGAWPGARRRGTRPESTGGLLAPPASLGRSPPAPPCSRTTRCDTMRPPCLPQHRAPAAAHTHPLPDRPPRPRTAARGLQAPAGAGRGPGSGPSAPTPAGPRTSRKKPFPPPGGPASRAAAARPPLPSAPGPHPLARQGPRRRREPPAPPSSPRAGPLLPALPPSPRPPPSSLLGGSAARAGADAAALGGPGSRTPAADARPPPSAAPRRPAPPPRPAAGTPLTAGRRPLGSRSHFLGAPRSGRAGGVGAGHRDSGLEGPAAP